MRRVDAAMGRAARERRGLTPPEIVRHDEDDVGLRRGGGLRQREEREPEGDAGAVSCSMLISTSPSHPGGQGREQHRNI